MQKQTSFIPGGLELYFLSLCQGSGGLHLPVPDESNLVPSSIEKNYYAVWGNPAFLDVPAQALPRGGISLAPSPELVPKPGAPELPPEACGVASALWRVTGRERAWFMLESCLFLQAFQTWCAGGVYSGSPVPKGI